MSSAPVEHTLTAAKPRGVQSVEVAGSLLDVLVGSAAPMMLRDLAQRADIPPGQAHVYLTSLRKLGLVEQDRATGRYQVGPFALRLAMGRLHTDRVLQQAADTASVLSRELSVTVTLTVWGSGAPTVILVREGPEEINVNLRPGRVFSVTTTATGRLFAAFRREPDVRFRIDQELASRMMDVEQERAFRAAFEAETAVSRACGHSLAVGAPLPNVNAIAAPVLDDAGEILCALTLVGRAATLDVGSGSQALCSLVARVAGMRGPTVATQDR